MKLIDTHCHPQMANYDADRQAMIERSLEAGIGLIAVGTTLADSLEGIRLAERYPTQPVYAAVGVHPHDAKLFDDAAEGLRDLDSALFVHLRRGMPHQDTEFH